MAEVKTTTASKGAARKRATNGQNGGAAAKPLAESQAVTTWPDMVTVLRVYELNNPERRIVTVLTEIEGAPALYKGIHSNARVEAGKQSIQLDNGEQLDI